VSQGKFDQAQKYIGIALQIKQNYTEAIFLLSQIQVNNGQIKDAITSVQFAIQTQPNNSLLYFQLGLLQYNDKNYQGAVDALQKAIQINDQYANARYFLGLAYARLGKNPDAIIQFENLNSTNPENDEVKEILTNLKAGKSPFSDVKTPIDSKPEKRKTLPVKEKHQ
jgi:tetratricopeptide (TPR) repeat protein